MRGAILDNWVQNFLNQHPQAMVIETGTGLNIHFERVDISPHLQVFDRPLLQSLAKHIAIAQWEYQQMPDEPCSFDIALALLHDYLKQRDCPIHLIGHGISGLLALLYAQRHPARVRSLTLLSVGAYPAVDWQAYYYAQRQLFPCKRQTLLTHMVDI